VAINHTRFENSTINQQIWVIFGRKHSDLITGDAIKVCILKLLLMQQINSQRLTSGLSQYANS
jgi:hypothetical protein